MPIGSAIVAARVGLVVQVEESHRDGEVAPTGFDNLLVIAHEDGTACPTLPVNFRNTDPNPEGLLRGRAYRAE